MIGSCPAFRAVEKVVCTYVIVLYCSWSNLLTCINAAFHGRKLWKILIIGFTAAFLISNSSIVLKAAAAQGTMPEGDSLTAQ